MFPYRRICKFCDVNGPGASKLDEHIAWAAIEEDRPRPHFPSADLEDP